MRQLQSGNASLINTVDNFHIKELDWKSKTNSNVSSFPSG